MLSWDHFYDESAPDHSCQRQPDPDGHRGIFTHDPRKLPIPPLALSPSLSARANPSFINVNLNLIYWLNAKPLKMPVGESLPFQRPLPHERSDQAHPRSMPDYTHPTPYQHIQFLALNRDVLTTISYFCPVSVACQLALTCKDAYDFTMPRIIADVRIGDPGEDDGPDRLEKFCAFMLAKPADRMRHLRALRLLDGAFARAHLAGRRQVWGADFSPADILTRLLREATNLRVIHIRDAEPLFQSHPSVYEALADLRNLRELSLYYIGNSSLKAMSQLRSRPAVIENGLWKDGPRPQGDITPFGPYVTSLRHLKLWECGCMLESVIDRHVWPNVHTLDIGGRIAKISELAHAFPNLQRLTFFMEFSIKQETGPAVCWPELDYLETSSPIPSFPSPVRRVQLQYGIGARAGSQNDLKTLPLMEKTNPVVLSCTICHSLPATMLERMKTSMPSLRYVELVLNDAARLTIPPQLFESWLESHLELFRSTPLVGLCITYEGAGTRDPHAGRRHLAHVAHLLAREIKTLEYVAVGYHDGDKRMYDSDATWFRVDSRPLAEVDEEERGGTPPYPSQSSQSQPVRVPVLEALSPAEGERVRERLLATPRE